MFDVDNIGHTACGIVADWSETSCRYLHQADFASRRPRSHHFLRKKRMLPRKAASSYQLLGSASAHHKKFGIHSNFGKWLDFIPPEPSRHPGWVYAYSISLTAFFR